MKCTFLFDILSCFVRTKLLAMHHLSNNNYKLLTAFQL